MDKSKSRKEDKIPSFDNELFSKMPSLKIPSVLNY